MSVVFDDAVFEDARKRRERAIRVQNNEEPPMTIAIPQHVMDKIEADCKAERRKLWKEEVKDFDCGRTSELIAFLTVLDEANGILIAVLTVNVYGVGGPTYTIMYRAKDELDVEVLT